MNIISPEYSVCTHSTISSWANANWVAIFVSPVAIQTSSQRIWLSWSHNLAPSVTVKLTANHYVPPARSRLVDAMSNDTRYAILPSVEAEHEEYVLNRPKRSRFRATWLIIGVQNLVIIILTMLLLIRTGESNYVPDSVFPQLLYCTLFVSSARFNWRTNPLIPCSARPTCTGTTAKDLHHGS